MREHIPASGEHLVSLINNLLDLSAVPRVRDMTDKKIEPAMEPFRQIATATRWGSGGAGLGLPLTEALAEGNRPVPAGAAGPSSVM